MSYCQTETAVKNENDKTIAVSLYCRSWGCEHCRETRHHQLTAEAAAGQPNMFLTFTMRPEPGKSMYQNARKLSHAFRLLRLRIQRKWPNNKFPFIAVFERHKSGQPHLHVLARSPFIPHRWLSAQMRELCDGPNVWVERLDKTHKAISYCVKYCSKCANKIGTCKRYWQSKDYDLRPEEEARKYKKRQGGWERWTKDINYLRTMFLALSYTILVDEPDRIEFQRPNLADTP